MVRNEIQLMLSDEVIMSKIYHIRGMNVMLDRDLAILYEIETKRLKEQVRRNLNRFPEDFMFEITNEELKRWKSQFGDSNKEITSLHVPPFAFTEYGIVMLASVLRNEKAIEVNIQIVRVFIKMKKLLANQRKLVLHMTTIERKVEKQDQKIGMIFKYLKKIRELQDKPRTRIGYKQKGKNSKTG
jgi:hypothetical protein